MSTLKDVAKAAGVSSATVSRYLTGHARLSDETRADVERAIRELNYRPNRVARRLQATGGRSGLLGLVIPDMRNPFFTDIGHGVEDAAQQHGYTVILGHSNDSVEREARYLDLFHAEHVDGVVLPTVRSVDATVADLSRGDIPVVCVDRKTAAEVDTVISDNVKGARLATEHLLALGHRRIGFVGGLPEISTTQERLAGYRGALAAAGLPVCRELIVEGDSRQESGRLRTGRLLALPTPPTALLGGNNLMTLGALQAIREQTLRIPDDVAIVGYDDMPWSSAFTPPLTAVDQPGYEMGRRAAEILLRRIEAPDTPPRTVVLHPRLVVRGSCGAVAG